MKNVVNDNNAAKKTSNKKGFTLIELLAVIIILGVLMIIAVPSVTKYINDSRKTGYISTANGIVTGARNLINSGSLDLNDLDTTYYIDGECIQLDNGYKSPYGDITKSYVVVTATNDGHDYFFTSVDDTGTGVKKLIKLDKLDSENIENNININDITPTIGIDKRDKIVVISGENCVKENPIRAEKIMNSETGRIKEVCPESYTPTIYWALQDTNSDGKNDKLILSNNVVDGVLKGSVSGNSTSKKPWIGSGSYTSSTNYSYYVKEVEIVGTISPASAKYYFAGVGAGAETFSADLNNFEMCHVTDVDGMFYNTGTNSSSFYLDIRDWDTSSVTNMSCMFCSAGSQAVNLKVDGLETLNTSNVTNMDGIFVAFSMNVLNFSLDLSKWDTRNVTNMSTLFASIGWYSQSFYLNISGWDTSKVTNMSGMLSTAGYSSTTWQVDGLENLNTSKVTDMSSLFDFAGVNATSIRLDLSKWDTSNVTNMAGLFSAVGYYSSTFDIDISKFDTSKVTNMTEMFSYNAPNAENFSVKIPLMNKNGINNTSNKFYGSTTSVYGELPSDKYFTLVFAN